MLTIKHISPGGMEWLIPALNVSYDPLHFAQSDVPEPRGYVWYTDPETHEMGSHRIDQGTVYVMNENGSTVARYFLAPGPGPAVLETPVAAA